MKVSVRLEKPDNRPEHFTTSHELVKGVVSLRLAQKAAVVSITATLSGRIDVCLMRSWTGAGELDWVEDEHELFRRIQILFPPQDVPLARGGYTLPKGVHLFPFELRFPIISIPHNRQDVTQRATTLPPSFQFDIPGNKGHAKSRYSVTVRVQRPGLLHRDKEVVRDVSFMPLDPDLPPPMLDPAVGAHFGRHVIFEATLPSPSVLLVGHTIPLRLFARARETPGEEHTPTSATLRNLKVSLHTKTMVAVGAHRSNWTSKSDIVCASGIDLPLGDLWWDADESTEINSELWENAVVPDVIPSFTTYAVCRQFSLVIAAEIVCGPGHGTELVKTSINVEVHSGITPPPDLAPESIPWRVGMEGHLGITRDTDDEMLANVPPPYF